MLNVYITVDTEVWPRGADWRATALAADLQRDIWGVTPQGEFGIGFQMDVLDAHGLKGVFLVESLFACEMGLEPLARITRSIQQRGHDVQLHVHSEWLPWMTSSILPGRTGQNMKDFSVDEQAILIQQGIDNLRACGVHNVCAFRAGNYGGNFDTLRALARCGIAFDTTYNFCYLNSACGMDTGELLPQPRQLHGVWEFPVNCFMDWPGHYRHAQLCATSASELEHAMLQAWKRDWHSFVIVSHSFELLKARSAQPTPDRIVIKRFQRLCRFLGSHRDKFRTATFTETDPTEIPATFVNRPLSSPRRLTVGRFAEQLVRRVF